VKISFTRAGWEGDITWTTERTILKRISRMIEEADVLLAAGYRLGGLPARDPVPGIGKPERLSHNLSGCWSRRITGEHRLVDEFRDNALSSCRPLLCQDQVRQWVA
jgi:toxin YoeB